MRIKDDIIEKAKFTARDILCIVTNKSCKATSLQYSRIKASIKAAFLLSDPTDNNFFNLLNNCFFVLFQRSLQALQINSM